MYDFIMKYENIFHLYYCILIINIKNTFNTIASITIFTRFNNPYIF